MREELETTVVRFDADTGVGTLTLNRPDSLNAFNEQMKADIVDGLRRLEAINESADDIPLRVVILEGAGDNFCVGADVNEFDEQSEGGRSERRHYDFLMDFPVPLIAKIEGYCLGGGFETALACDLRIAHDDSQFGLPEVNLGLHPGGGGIQFVSVLANSAVAEELALTGKRIGATEAAEYKLVNQVVGDEIMDVTRSIAESVAAKPPLATQAIKQSARMSSQTGLNEGRKYDRRIYERLRQTEDHEKGTRAFAEDDYEPEFTGS